MKKFKKYKTNLSHDSKFVYSYGTKVAQIKGRTLAKLGYWSTTTSKHINYAAKELDLIVLQIMGIVGLGGVNVAAIKENNSKSNLKKELKSGKITMNQYSFRNKARNLKIPTYSKVFVL